MFSPVISLIALLFLVHDAVAVGQPWADSRYVLVPHARETLLYRVSGSGEAEAVPFDFDTAGYGTVGLGGSWPILSPDNRWVAFVRARDLWLCDLRAGNPVRITRLRGGECDSLGCGAYLTQWSPDSRRLLYCIAPMFSERCRWSTPCEGTGFHVYDVQDGTFAGVVIRGAFQWWLPDGRVVVTGDSEYTFEGFLVDTGDLGLFDPSNGERVPLLPGACSEDRFCFSQITGNAAGTRLALTYHPRNNEGQIAEVNLVSRRIDPVTRSDSGIRFQSPSYSPTGRHLAYLEFEKRRTAPPRTRVWVDGRSIFACDGQLSPRACSWISDNAMAITVGDTLRVVDVKTGAVRATPVRVGQDQVR